MSWIDTRIILVLMGGGFLVGGILGISGIWKRWYWRSPRMIYAYMPIGIMFFLAALEQSVDLVQESTKRIIYASYFVLLGIAVWWLITPPAFIRPAWIRRIEEEPKWVYRAMVAAIKDGEDWSTKVATLEVLSKWIQSIKQRRPRQKKC